MTSMLHGCTSTYSNVTHIIILYTGVCCRFIATFHVKVKNVVTVSMWLQNNEYQCNYNMVIIIMNLVNNST